MKENAYLIKLKVEKFGYSIGDIAQALLSGPCYMVFEKNGSIVQFLDEDQFERLSELVPLTDPRIISPSKEEKPELNIVMPKEFFGQDLKSIEFK